MARLTSGSRQLLLLILLTFWSQVAAFCKLWLVARIFGVGTDLDGYNLAFSFPSLLTGVVFGTVQTGLFPVYAKVRSSAGDRAASDLERLIFWVLLLFGITILLLAILLEQPLVELLAGRGSAVLIESTRFVFQFAVIGLLLNLMGDFFGFLLALRGRFFAAAVAPILNACVGIGLLVAWPEGGLTNLAVGTVLGTAAQVLLLVWVATRHGFSAVEPIDKIKHRWRDLLEMLTLGSLILPGTFFVSLVNTLPAIMLVPYGAGTISAFGYAIRLHQAAVQLFVLAAGPVLLSKFSDLVVQNQWPALEKLRRRAFWASVFVGILALLAVALFGKYVLLVFFANGKFDEIAAQHVFKHWFVLSLCLGFALYGNVLSKRLQAERHAATLSLIAFLGLLALLAGYWGMRPLVGEYAVSGAFALSSVITMTAMSFVVRSIHDRRRNSTAAILF